MDNQLAMARDSYFEFGLSSDMNLGTARFEPDGFTLAGTTPESVSYVTSSEYNEVSPGVLPLRQPSISPASFASSSASTSPDNPLFPDRFGMLPGSLFPQTSQEAVPVVPSVSVQALPTADAVHAAAAVAAAEAVAVTTAEMAAMAAVAAPSNPALATNPAPAKAAAETNNNKNGNSKNADGTTNKPRRKRPNRYHGASEELMQRRRDQNRHSQRAYRERKDQKIKDLEADVAKKNCQILQLRSQLSSQMCLRCGGANGYVPTPVPTPPAALPQPTTAAAAAAAASAAAARTRPPPPPPPPQQQPQQQQQPQPQPQPQHQPQHQPIFTHQRAPATLPTFAPGLSGFHYRPAFDLHHPQAGLAQPPMSIFSSMPVGPVCQNNAALYGLPGVAGTQSALLKME